MSTITRTTIKDRAHWLSMRALDVTASAAGALLINEDGESIHEYMTRYQLWLEKTGNAAPFDETDSVRRGKRMEKVAVEILQEEHPEIQFSVPNFYVRDSASRLGATPDLSAYCEKRGGPGNVQIKSVEAGIYRMKWVDRETGAVTPPLWIVVQSIIEAHLTGAKWAAVAPIVVGHGIDVPLIDVPLHEGVIERVKEVVADFWLSVESGVAPPPDYSRDGDAIKHRYSLGGGEALDLSKHNRIAFLCEEKAAWTLRRSNAEGALEEVDNEIRDVMKDAELGNHPDFKITLKSQKTGGYTVPEGKTRVLRVTRKKQTGDVE